ncbi:hypothetical protein HHI36_014724 [Cryptolaemus montrouzieri]|uniref:Uncharacterized protein n=1 Tax=Cryptolaemus montrouzieri TaxID=559131 RepID=A0ABD2N3G1_9CUCU
MSGVNHIHLLFIMYTSLVLLEYGNSIRVKRKIAFTKNSKFFIRLNGKTNVLNITSIFAHGWSIRINYDLPDSLQKMHKIFRRNTDSFDGANGFPTLLSTLVRKKLCRTFNVPLNISTCGFFCEIKRIIHRSSGSQTEFLQSFLYSECYNDRFT